MLIKDSFSQILNYVISKTECSKQDKDLMTEAIDIISESAVYRLVDALDDNSERDIMDFLYALQELSDVGEHHLAIGVIKLILTSAGQTRLAIIIDALLSTEEQETYFIEEFVDIGADYCFFKSIGLE